MNKYFTIYALLLLVIFGCKDEPLQQPIIQDIEEWVFAPGQLEWDDQYSLSSQSEGILHNVVYDIGSTLNANQIVAQVDNKSSAINTKTSKDQVNIANQNLTNNAPAIQQLKSNIQIAQKKYEFDKSQADRYADLYKNQNVSRVEFESTQLAAENSLSNLNALKSQYDLLMQQAKVQSINAQGQYANNKIIESYNNISTLAQGTVVKKVKSNGDFVRRGEIIAVIGNAEKVEIVLNVDESNIGRIKVGQKAKVRLNIAKDKVFDGVVNEVQNAFDESTQSFVCKIVLNEKLPAELNIFGTPVECNILVGFKNNALLIPREYLGFNNRVRIKSNKDGVIVKTGIISTDYVEILEGLTQDEFLLPIKP
ncbi:MAG TPA: efflux RND transporter periplasmic adaptor subunit [Saprospiraceae bacterium]|nr:efflux RND transporter periplasmic adaptor subunit [Saprospiraceae bacterium]